MKLDSIARKNNGSIFSLEAFTSLKFTWSPKRYHKSEKSKIFARQTLRAAARNTWGNCFGMIAVKHEVVGSSNHPASSHERMLHRHHCVDAGQSCKPTHYASRAGRL